MPGGLKADLALCAELSEAAGGCPATSVPIAVAAILDRIGAMRVAVITPENEDYAARGVAGLARELAGVRALNVPDNFSGALIPMDRIIALARELVGPSARNRPEALLLWSTNLCGWDCMAPLEEEFGIPVLDSAAAGVWGTLLAAGIDPTPAAQLGQMFRLGSK
jgi:maleate isomerase